MATSRTQYGTVPKLSQESETSATEWAKETEGAIYKHSSGKLTDIDRSNVTTPGYECPGAFPMASSSQGPTNSVYLGDTSKRTVEGGYMTTHDGIEGVYATAEHAVRQYLPTSVVDKLEEVGVLRENPEYQDNVTLPTQHSNFTQTYGSVSSLPGSKDELGVEMVPEMNKEGEVTGFKDITVDPETGSHQSTYKPPHFWSSTPNISPQSPQSPVLNSDMTPGTVNSNMVPFVTQQSNSNNPNTNVFESSHPAATLSASSTPVSRTGTLTSPDSDAQAAAQVRWDEMGLGKRTLAGSGTGDRSRTTTESNTKGGSNKDTELQTGEGSMRYDMSQESSQTIKHTDSSHIHGGEGVVRKEDAVISNGKGGRTRKSSFIQKLKGEVKAFVGKVKTKTRG